MKKLLIFIKAITIVASIAAVIAFLCERIAEIQMKEKKNRHQPFGNYERFFKRPLDCFFSSCALILLSPVLLILTILGAIGMKGNPFFVYPRAGRDGKIFKLIKFRTMANLKDKDGNFLPDEIRLTRYGRLLRSTSLDELPELINILLGDMAIIGPRPLTYKYLDYYTEEESHRHDVRPGLTGLAQINGRNAISWEERFKYDLQYVNHLSFLNDLNILAGTVIKVIKRADIGEGNATIQSLHEIRTKNDVSIAIDKGGNK